MKTIVQIHKAAGKKQIIQCAVLVPLVVDLQGDWMTKEDIADAAWNFLAEYNVSTKLKQEHSKQGDIMDKAQLVESFLVPDGNSVTLGTKEYPEGTWIVSIRILDGDLWSAIESGQITGLSVGGLGTRTKKPLGETT